jgi:hypothetical protein
MKFACFYCVFVLSCGIAVIIQRKMTGLQSRQQELIFHFILGSWYIHAYIYIEYSYICYNMYMCMGKFKVLS